MPQKDGDEEPLSVKYIAMCREEDLEGSAIPHPNPRLVRLSIGYGRGQKRISASGLDPRV